MRVFLFLLPYHKYFMNMNYSIIILGREIPIYGICFYLGIAIAALVASFICKKVNLPSYEIHYSAVFVMIGAIIGSKLLFILVSYRKIIELNVSLFAVIKGGFVFYGGLMGGFFGLLLYCTIYKIEFLRMCDVYTAVLPLGHAVGRVGCFFAGCCYGRPYNGFGAVTYTSTVGQTPVNTPLLPIQLIEAWCLLTLFVILIFIYMKSKKTGTPSAVYLCTYAVIRFVLEYFRGDTERGKLLFLYTSQWISIALFLGGAFIIYIMSKKTNERKTINAVSQK